MRRSLSFQIIFSVSALIILVRLVVNITNTISDFGDYYKSKRQQLAVAAQLILDQEERSPKTYDDLYNYLEVAKVANLIDFYQIEQNGAVKFKTDNVGNLDVGIPPSDQVMAASNVFFLKLRLTNFDINFGFFGQNKYAYWIYFKRDYAFIFLDLALLVMVVILMVRYRLSILTAISGILSQVTPQDLKKLDHPSQEIHIIINFLRSFIEQLSKSESLRSLFGRNIADGILHELAPSGKFGLSPAPIKKPPYPIETILVRFDMNNYTRRALQENTEQLTALLSRYFRKVKELRLRYGGLDYQFIGDEKVLFFKIEEGQTLQEQLLLAVAFLRDAFELAKKMSEQIPLTFKAAVVPGTLTFYELDESHYFTGTPLIESARYLTTISEKDRSILSMPAALSTQIEILSKPFHQESVVLKGYENPLTIAYFDSIRSDFVETSRTNPMEASRSKPVDPKLFLSDSGLCQILAELTSLIEADRGNDSTHSHSQAAPLDNTQALNLPTAYAIRFTEIFHRLRDIPIQEVEPEVAVAYEKLLSRCVEIYGPIEVQNKILANAISMSRIFVPQGSETAGIKEKLLKLVAHKDVRVSANALAASQRYEWNEKLVKDMLQSPSNRIRGDALALIGCREINEAFFSAWRGLVESENLNFILSGLWVGQEVLKFHLEKNPTHFKSNPLVENMISTIRRHLKSSQAEVVQRAQWALAASQQS